MKRNRFTEEQIAPVLREHVTSDGVIWVAQQKTRVRLPASILESVQAYLRTHNDALIFHPVHHHDAFRNRYKRATRAIGEPGMTRHGARFTAARNLWNLGLPRDLIAAITGHQTLAMVEKYAELGKHSTEVAAAYLAATEGVRPERAQVSW